MASQTHHNLLTIPTTKTKPEPGKMRASRALWKLVVALLVPLFLTTTTITVFGAGHKYYYGLVLASTPIFWFPSLWFIHLASLCSSFLMGLAAWLVWAEGGFHSQSDALPLYVAQVSLSIVWDPLVLVVEVPWLGFLFCAIHFGTLFACYLSFQRVNDFAKVLVTPCLAWFAYLTFVSSRLTYSSLNFTT